MVQWTNLVIFDIYVIVLHNCNTVNMSTTTGSCRIPVAKYFLIAMLLDFWGLSVPIVGSTDTVQLLMYDKAKPKV